MSQLLLEPLVLFLGFVMLCCAFCAACLFPLSDFVWILALSPRGNSRELWVNLGDDGLREAAYRGG